MDNARAYINSSNLEQAISEGITTILQERPSNPILRMSELLAAVGAAGGGPLNILLQEDLTIRGGAQLWIMNCGSRLQEAGHQVTFLLPDKSLIVDDCRAIKGAIVETYDEEKIAANSEAYREQFTKILTPAHVCVTLVRQQRGTFQNVGFMGDCIAKAG